MAVYCRELQVHVNWRGAMRAAMSCAQEGGSSEPEGRTLDSSGDTGAR